MTISMRRLDELIEKQLDKIAGAEFNGMPHMADEARELLEYLRAYRDARGRWVPWKPGDPLPPITSEHWVTRERGHTDKAIAGRRYWTGVDRVIAYWSVPLPDPYIEGKDHV